MQRTLCLLSLLVAACTVTTTNRPPPREPPPRVSEPAPEHRPPPPPEHHPDPRPAPPPFTWDNKGWTMIGERSVDGKLDADSINVTVGDTRYNRLTVVVLDSDLELVEMSLNFKSGKHYATDIKNVAFRENTRTRVVNLPSEVLTRVDFKYKNLPGGGNARIQLWGRFEGVAPTAPVWDTKGWTMLGERLVDGKMDSDKIDVDPKIGRIGQLTFVVLDADLEMLDSTVAFKSGKSYHPDVKQVFKENSRTRVLKLPSEVLTKVEFKYKNLTGERARVQVWGKP